MRELKFRAWGRYGDEIGNTGKPQMIHDWQERGLVECVGFDGGRHFDIMQYTGLKDENGEKVYEGDILENVKGHRFVMEYGGLAFGWRGLTPYANGMVKFSYDTITNPNITELTELEVIGNIYENPELLEKVNDDPEV